MRDFDNALLEGTLDATGRDAEAIDLDLDAVLEDAIDLASANRRDQHLDFVAVRASALPRGLRGDPARLRRALLDLAADASKHTTDGQVLLRADLVRDEGGTVEARFSANDIGIGDAPNRCNGSAFSFTLRMQKQRVQPQAQRHALQGGRGIIAAESAAMRYVLSEHLIGCGMNAVATSLDYLHTRIDAGPEGSGPFHIALIDCDVADSSWLSKLVSLLDDRRLARLPVVLIVPEHKLSPRDAALPAVTHKLRKPVRRSDIENLLVGGASLELEQRCRSRKPGQDEQD